MCKSQEQAFQLVTGVAARATFTRDSPVGAKKRGSIFRACTRGSEACVCKDKRTALTSSTLAVCSLYPAWRQRAGVARPVTLKGEGKTTKQSRRCRRRERQDVARVIPTVAIAIKMAEERCFRCLSSSANLTNPTRYTSEVTAGSRLTDWCTLSRGAPEPEASDDGSCAG